MARPPHPLETEDSVLEGKPQAERPETKRALGEAAREAVELGRPKGKRREATARIGVSLRAATLRKPDDEKTAERHAHTKKSVQAGRDARRQAIWDKLDASRKKAEQRLNRLKSFEPEHSVAEEEGDDEDFDF